MQLLPKFKIYNQDSGQTGTFQLPDIDPETDDLFMNADDLYFEMEFDKSKKLLRKIISKQPGFTEAYHLLADIARDENKHPEAEAILKEGVQHFKQAIPAEFEGEIPWGLIDNRPFLMLLHELLLSFDRNEKTKEAIDTGEQILAYNPNDNQSIRWLMGDLYLRNEQLKEAEKYLRQNADQYPPNRYSYALLLMKQNKRWDAATQFRLGFIENIYVSEMLRLKAPLIRYEVFEPSNLNGLDTATDYVLSMGDYWFQHLEAMQMMDILMGHQAVSTEINSVFNHLQEIYLLPLYDNPLSSFDESENDMDIKEMNWETREELFKEIDKIKKNVNTSSSKKILKDLDGYWNKN